MLIGILGFARLEPDARKDRETRVLREARIRFGELAQVENSVACTLDRG